MCEEIIFEVVGLLQIYLIVLSGTTVIIIGLLIRSAMIIRVRVVELQQFVITNRLRIRSAYGIIETACGLIRYQVLTTDIVYCSIRIIECKWRDIRAITLCITDRVIQTDRERTTCFREFVTEQ